MSQGLDVHCGPLLNYKGMSYENNRAYWHGSVLVVTNPGQKQPRLQLKSLGPVTSSSGSSSQAELVEGLKLYADMSRAFWRFSLHVPLEQSECKWEYDIPDMVFQAKLNTSSTSRIFVVPSVHESMRIMFHAEKPFHVMIGGGDQVISHSVTALHPHQLT